MRRTGPCFEPPEVLAYLEGSFRDGEAEKTRVEAVKIYFRLKQLMYEIDDIDDSSDEEGNKKEHKCRWFSCYKETQIRVYQLMDLMCHRAASHICISTETLTSEFLNP